MSSSVIENLDLSDNVEKYLVSTFMNLSVDDSNNNDIHLKDKWVAERFVEAGLIDTSILEKAVYPLNVHEYVVTSQEKAIDFDNIAASYNATMKERDIFRTNECIGSTDALYIKGDNEKSTWYLIEFKNGDWDCNGIREKIYDKVLTLGPKFSDDVSIAGLTQVSMEGIEQLDLYYSNYLPQFFYAMIAPFILFFVTVFLSWQPAVSLICLVPMIPISIVAVSKYAKIIFAKYWGKYTSMGDAFLDATQGLKDLKIFKADKKRQEIMNESAEEFRKITMKVLVMQLASSTIMDTVAYGGAGLGIALTILGLINNWINPIGNMVSVAPIALFIILVSVDFFLPMRQFGSAFHVGMNGFSRKENTFAFKS